MADPWQALISGATFQTQPRSRGSRVDAAYVVDGLVRRGLPRHVAEGFAMNMQDESGFDPGINERNPSVKGSRGGYGLYQLTGPRRRAYEAFAAQRGVDLANPDAQMDFLMYELQGPEKGAAQAIMGTSSAGEAGAAIVNKFLRPAAQHARSRTAKYLGGQTGYASEAPRQQSPTRLWLDIGKDDMGVSTPRTANRLWLGGLNG